MADVLSGYPRSAGIETAVRILSPQYIICDEILTEADCDAMITAVGSGVNLAASVHGESYDALRRQPLMKRLMEHEVFDTFVGLIPGDSGGRYRIEITGASR